MPINFITGAAGAGKTELVRELTGLGYQAYDTDDPNRTGIAGWHNLSNGKYVAGFNEIENLTEAFFETHIWRLTEDALTNFKELGAERPIYLCGRLKDAADVIKMSKHIGFLVTPPAVIRNRLQQRAQIPGKVTWGREPWQIEKSIAVNRELETEYQALGAIMINSDQPPVEVAAEVVAKTAVII